MKLLYVCITNYLILINESHGSAPGLDLNNVVEGLRKMLFNELKNGNVSESCAKIMPHLLNATDMIDASSKLQSGILYGNLYNLGEYDECVDANHMTEDGLLQGKYCMISVGVNASAFPTDPQMQKEQMLKKMTRQLVTQTRDGMMPSLELKMALCIPHVCELENITNSLNSLLMNISLPVTISNLNCNIKNDTKYNGADIFAILLFSLFGILLLSSTLYDLLMDSSRKKPLLTAFSVYTNANRLLTIHPPNKSADEISCVHGIRALSIFWVVLGHRFSVAIMGPTMNTTYVFTKWVQNIGSTYLTGATVSVDTFFVMSGMLLTFIFLKQMRTSTDFKPAMFYLHRFLRLTPALAAVVLFEATLLIRMRDGPLWETNLKALKSTCEKAWWQTLLYIQNYYNPDGICVGQSWYLAVDTQLFWMSPFILLPLWKWPKKTLMAIVTLIFTSVIIIAIISYIDEYPGGIMDPRDPFMLNMKYIYMPTHTRYGPWLVGVLLGYFLHRTKEVRLDMNKYVVGFTWAAVLATLLAVVLGAHPFYKLDGSSTLSQNVAFLSLHRLAWGICIAWIVFACKNGYGGPINWFLSLGFWQPISRLSYSLYLVHMDVQMIIWMATRTNLNFSDADLFINFASDITLGLAVALVWSLTFESPILILEKQLLGRGGKREAVQTRHVENGYENSVYSNKDQRAIFS